VTVPLLLIFSVALACAASAIFLWHAAATRVRRTSVLRRLGGRLAAAPAPAPAARRRGAPGPGFLAAWCRRLDLAPAASTALLVFGPAPLLASAVAMAAGWPVAAVAFVLFVLLTCMVLAVRREAVQRRLVRAVPGFVDAMVRTIVLGQSTGAAFIAATQAVEGSLRRTLEHTQGLVAAGLELDAALTQTGRTYDSEALLLLGSVIRMSTQYGGRVDQVLERVAAFLRDREEAEQELIAVSAETRMSAWVLGLLPVVVTVLILFANSTYLAGMWVDATGRKLLLGAFGLELVGGYFLYRLARFR
jgi:tight adherence protein B